MRDHGARDGWWRAGLVVVACATGLARAAAAGDDVALADRLTMTASTRLRGELVDWFAPPPGAPAGVQRYDFFGSHLRLGLRLTYPHAQLVVEGQETVIANLPGDAILPRQGALGPGATYVLNTNRTTQSEPFLRQAFLTLRRAGLGVTGGRFEYRDGLETVPSNPTLAAVKRTRVAERLIGPFGFTHVGRTFDGLRVTADRGPWNVTAVAFHPTDGGFEISANREIGDISVAGISATLGRIPIPGAPPVDVRLFYLYYEDDRPHAVKVDNRPLAVRTADHDSVSIHSGGGHALAAIPAGPGTIDLLLWGLVQGGAYGRLDHSAWAWAAEAGYQLPRWPGAPWLRVGGARTSGDSDPHDGRHGTFFQLLPTARTYALFPFYNLMNLEDVFTELILRPHRMVTLRSDAHWLRVTEPSDLWYSGGGATNDDVFGYAGLPTGDHRELAYVVDLGVTVEPHPRVTLGAYYGHAFGQGAVGASFAGRDADYGFVEVTLSY